MQSTEFTRPRRKNEFWQTESTPHYAPVCAERMRDNLCLDKTKKSHSEISGVLWIQRLVQFLKNQDQNCRCKTLTELHQRAAIGRTKNYKDEKYMQKNHTRTRVWVRMPRRKFMKQAIASCIRQNSSNSLQTSTWHSKEYDGEVYTIKEYDAEVVQTLSHYWKWQFAVNQKLRFKIPHKSIIENQKESMRRETEEHSLTHLTIGGKHEFFVVPIFRSRVVLTRVRTHVVATIVCATERVHTLTCCTHIFLVHIHCAYTSHIHMRVTHMHGSRVLAVRMSSSLCDLIFSLLMFHPSLLLLFLDGHFKTVPDFDDVPVHTILSALRTRTRSLATWSILQTCVLVRERDRYFLPEHVSARVAALGSNSLFLQKLPVRVRRISDEGRAHWKSRLQRGAVWNARPERLGNVVCPTSQSCWRHHAVGLPCSFAGAREDRVHGAG